MRVGVREVGKRRGAGEWVWGRWARVDEGLWQRR